MSRSQACLDYAIARNSLTLVNSHIIMFPGIMMMTLVSFFYYRENYFS